jgi:hypothetical protein
MAKKQIEVAALRHRDKRRNIPTAELESVMRDEEKNRKTGTLRPQPRSRPTTRLARQG